MSSLRTLFQHDTADGDFMICTRDYGDVIQWKVPGGTVHLEVVKILYQPEAAGDFEL